MLNHALARAAFRNRAAALVVATTGSVTLSATATGYARTSGSFLTDGFAIGMELVPTGFTQLTPGVVAAVTALALTIDGGRTVQSAASGRTLSVGLPAIRALENTLAKPVVGRPYIVEQWVPGGSSAMGIPRRTALIREDGLSVWTWYFIIGTGTEAIDACIDALIARFTPGTPFVLGNGSTVVVRGDTTVKRGQIVNIDGWATVTVKIPWEVKTRNSIAA